MREKVVLFQMAFKKLEPTCGSSMNCNLSAASDKFYSPSYLVLPNPPTLHFSAFTSLKKCLRIFPTMHLVEAEFVEAEVQAGKRPSGRNSPVALFWFRIPSSSGINSGSSSRPAMARILESASRALSISPRSLVRRS
jgi:hypothetical protein